jgi:hypothetical protein
LDTHKRYPYKKLKEKQLKNILLILHAMVLIMTLSIVVIPNLWMISIVGGGEGLKGISFPLIWTIYALLVFFSSAFTFSWLIRK